jgi:hypothetical protein
MWRSCSRSPSERELAKSQGMLSDSCSVLAARRVAKVEPRAERSDALGTRSPDIVRGLKGRENQPAPLAPFQGACTGAAGFPGNRPSASSLGLSMPTLRAGSRADRISFPLFWRWVRMARTERQTIRTPRWTARSEVRRVPSELRTSRINERRVRIERRGIRTAVWMVASLPRAVRSERRMVRT